jgi:hypothetical protein
LEFQPHSTLPESFQALTIFAMLAIAPFIMFYPDENAAPEKMGMQSNSPISAMVSWPSL